MAWVCLRCQRKIFAPREEAVRYAFQWKYVKKTGELLMDLKNLTAIKNGAIVTHLHCPAEEKPGFKERMKDVLKMPAQREHPLIF